jgi:hypothetical protein
MIAAHRAHGHGVRLRELGEHRDNAGMDTTGLEVGNADGVENGIGIAEQRERFRARRTTGSLDAELGGVEGTPPRCRVGRGRRRGRWGRGRSGRGARPRRDLRRDHRRAADDAIAAPDDRSEASRTSGAAGRTPQCDRPAERSLRAMVRQRRPSRSWRSTVAGISLLTDTLTRHGAPSTDETGVEIRTVRSRAAAGATRPPHTPAAKATVTAHLRT